MGEVGAPLPAVQPVLPELSNLNALHCLVLSEHLLGGEGVIPLLLGGSSEQSTHLSVGTP